MEGIFRITTNLSIMPHPQGGRQLAKEIARLQKAGFNVLVSLITVEEISLLGLEKEEEECSRNKIRYIHFPVNDFSVPSDMNAFAELVEELSAAVRSGKKIIVHCRGGIGRSSLIAGALLVREGFTNAEAIALMAECRACKVPETAAQEKWLLNLVQPREVKRRL
jgi:protein-tyrosine phosphatase